MSIIKLPTPTVNIILVNQRTPNQILTRASAKQILRQVIKEEKVKIILEYLRDQRQSFSDLSLAQLQLSAVKKDNIQGKKKVKKKKVKELITTLLEDKEIRNAIIKITDIYLELINIVIDILYKELYNLQQKTVIFSLQKLDLEFKDVQLL